MGKFYYSLLERNDGQWSIQFGDYVRKVVEDEMADMFYRYKADMAGAPKNVKRRTKSYLYKIIKTSDDQSSIDEAVAAENLALQAETEQVQVVKGLIEGEYE